MSAKHFPAVYMSLNRCDESNGQPSTDYVVIDFQDSEDTSAGFIVLDDPAYLFLLRSAIDSFIKEHNIKQQITLDMKENEESKQPEVPAAVTILAQYMAQFMMTDSIRTPGVELKTTDDIINDLSSMCELEPNDVAALLVRTGFKTYHDADGRHGWMLVRRPFELDPNHPVKVDSLQ
ncbi:MAG: hypothetical protein K2M07_08280 [Muribaculaceae bacterium]|nr:hypothetical protein [Muribaculaceae bacterium]